MRSYWFKRGVWIWKFCWKRYPGLWVVIVQHWFRWWISAIVHTTDVITCFHFELWEDFGVGNLSAVFLLLSRNSLADNCCEMCRMPPCILIYCMQWANCYLQQTYMCISVPHSAVYAMEQVHCVICAFGQLWPQVYMELQFSSNKKWHECQCWYISCGRFDILLMFVNETFL